MVNTPETNPQRRRFDADVYLYVVGRMKDIIKTGSINVAPKEVEKVLLFHPDVANAAVVGVSDPEWENRFRRMLFCDGNMRSTKIN